MTNVSRVIRAFLNISIQEMNGQKNGHYGGQEFFLLETYCCC